MNMELNVTASSFADELASKASTPSYTDLYVCQDQDPSSIDCAVTCTGLEDCYSCDCAVTQDDGGPWGNAADVIFSLLPIVFLLVATLMPKPLDTTVSVSFQ